MGIPGSSAKLSTERAGNQICTSFFAADDTKEDSRCSLAEMIPELVGGTVPPETLLQIGGNAIADNREELRLEVFLVRSEHLLNNGIANLGAIYFQIVISVIIRNSSTDTVGLGVDGDVIGNVRIFFELMGFPRGVVLSFSTFFTR